MNNVDKIEVQFKVLKHPLWWEKLIPFVFFLLIVAITSFVFVHFSLEVSKYYPIYIVFGLGSWGFHIWYDKYIRQKVAGKGLLTADKICFKEQCFYFSDIKMMWVYFGYDTQAHKNERYKFEHFETIYLLIFDKNGKRHKFHVDNVLMDKYRLSSFIAEIKKHRWFFKIHMEESSRFSKQQYHKTLKRYAIMQQSLERRKQRKNR